MDDGKIIKHPSFGMISISRYISNNAEFYGSDLNHNGGTSITISNGQKERKLNTEWYHTNEDIISVDLSCNQFIDAITSGMNTCGVPCTIKRVKGESIPQISHVEDKKELFTTDMEETYKQYEERMNTILSMLDGKIGKRKADEIKHEVEILKSHMKSNTNFVMKCFNESMEKSVTEAKHSVANYIDSKVHALGVEGLRNQLQISIGNPDES